MESLFNKSFNTNNFEIQVLFVAGNLNKVSKGPQTTHAATTIQKNWRGHSARSTDDRVQELKDEVKNLRTDQHIRHLTKELSAAKLALERERKLRALQMDAIKVNFCNLQRLLSYYRIIISIVY